MTIFQSIKIHAGKYLFGVAFSSLVALFMMKYYTRVFSPAEFGVLALFLIILQGVKAIVSLNMEYGTTRLYFDYRKTRRDEYLSTIFWTITLIAIFTLFFGLLFMKPITNWILPNSELLYIVTIFSGIGAAYISFLTRILYNENKSTSVLKHSIFQTSINHMLSVLFISVFSFGIFGRMAGQGLSYFFNSIGLLREFFKEKLFIIKLVYDIGMAKETFILSLPLMFLYFQNVVFIYLDRVFIKHYIGDSAVGIYTLGYMLGQGLSMVYGAISQAILPKVYNDMIEDYDKARDELEHFSYRYYLGLVVITIIISTLSPFIVSLFSNENYSEASSVMPFVMAGFMMGGFYKIPSLVLGYHKIVWFYPVLAFFSFGTNALLNWWLIPIYGIVGAGFASFVGLFLYSYILQILSFKYFTLKYKLSMHVIYIFLLFIIMLLFIKQ